MATYGSILIPLPLEQAASVLREVCVAAYAAPAGPAFCLLHPDRFIDGNGVFSLAGPVSAALGVPVLAAFQYDGDRLELEVWRDGVRAYRYDSWPGVRDDEPADGTPADADPAAFLDFAAVPWTGTGWPPRSRTSRSTRGTWTSTGSRDTSGRRACTGTCWGRSATRIR